MRVTPALFIETGKVARTHGGLAGLDDWHVGYGGGLIVQRRDALVVTAQLAYGDALQFLFATDVLQAFRGRSKEL